MIGRESGVREEGVGVEIERARRAGGGEIHGVDAPNGRRRPRRRRRLAAGVVGSVDQDVVFGVSIGERTRQDLGSRHGFVELRLEMGSGAKRGERVSLDVDAGERPTRFERGLSLEKLDEIANALFFTVDVRDVRVGVHAEDARGDRVGVVANVRVRGGDDGLRL